MGQESRFSGVFGWPDAVLAAGGVLGLLLLIFVAPGEHPHSTASDYMPRAQAIDSARAFSQRHAELPLADARPNAEIRYDGELLRELQLEHGRRSAIAMLAAEDIPAYWWNVEWTRTTEEETESLGWTRITLDGRFLGTGVEASAIPRNAFHPGAMSEVIGDVPLDSLPPNGLVFRVDGPERAAPLSLQNLQSDRVFLDRDDAEKLALYHLRQSRLGNTPIRVDSVFASGADGLVTATVRVSSEAEELGRFFSTDIEVMPMGALVKLEPSFVPDEESEDDAMDANDIRQIATLVMFVLLAIIMVVVFFRRLNAKIVDTRTAIRDGLLAAIAASLAMSSQLVVDMDTSEPMEFVGMIIGVALVGLSGGILMFFVSGAALSMARERWDEKLQTLALVRSLYARNVPVGAALVRGVFAGLTLVAIGSLILLAFGDLALRLSSGGGAFFGELSSGLMFLRDVGGMFYLALFVMMAAVVGIGALSLRKKGSGLWSFVAVAITLALLQVVPWDFHPLPLMYVIGPLFGVLIAAVFWRYDALTTLLTLFVFHLTSATISDWSVPGAPEFIAAVLAILVVAVVAVIGFIGVMSGRRSSEVPVIVPDYIRELSQQERLKRELELAREVQLSFLPARTPEVLGLDLASVCLPANEVGGDYYDFFRMSDNRLGVVVGDVSGKGMQAAFYMTLMKGILQSLNTSLTRPSDILIAANDLFRMNAPRGIFMSIVLGVVDLKRRTWTCARAGHNPMLIHRAGAERPEEVKPRGAAIGLASDPTFSMNIEEATISLSPGDLLLIYTDGITEAMNRNRDLFDEARLDESIARASGRSAEDVLASIIHDVEQFRGDAPRHDDMTMVAIRILDYE